MNNKLYVSNLAFAVKDAELQELFSQFGNVISAKVITDRNTGRSKGFGFVELGNDAEAAQAIELLNGKEHLGRKLVIALARPKD